MQQDEFSFGAKEHSSEEYREALDYLYSQLPMFSRVGGAAYKPGLDTTLELDRLWNHPHRRFRSIHVGGTNGKGSTSHALASILQAQGYKTALYTSPHLVDFRERMKIDGQMIPRKKVVDFLRKWRAMDTDLRPSFFELTMMMAFDWFASENVDFALIEVGMGGRLDSTNIITPVGCVVTNISNDHTQFLGHTPEAIAREKAGIIKKGIPAIVGEAEGRVREVFENRAREVGTDIVFAQDCPRLTGVKETEGGWEAVAREGRFVFPLGGDYQLKNLNTVLNAVDMLRGCGMEIADSNVVAGLENVVASTGLAGRWMKLSDRPLVIADTGHNIAGIESNVGQLNRLMSKRHGGKLRIVIGFVADKTIDAILELLPRDAEYYVTAARIPRALPAPELRDRFEKAGFTDVRVFAGVKESVRRAKSEAGLDDVVFVGGSTFVVADALAPEEDAVEE